MKTRNLLLKSTVICVVLSLTMLALMVACSKPSLAAGTMAFPKDVKLGSSPGGARAVNEGLCSLVKKEMGIRAVPYRGSGATDRLLVLMDKQIDLSLQPNNVTRDAFTGTVAFKKKGRLPVRLLAGIQIAPIHMATWHGSGVKGIKDVRGKRYMHNFVTAPFVAAVGDSLLEFHGMTRKDVKVQSFSSFKDSMNTLRDRATDLLVHPGSRGGSSYWMELTTQVRIDFIPFTEEERLYVVKKNPYLVPDPVIVPAGVYKGLDKDVLCVGFMNSYIARADTNDDFVYKIMKILFDDVKIDKPGRFVQFHADVGSYTLKTALLAAGNAPFHAAAVKYYKERGVWTDKLEKTQKRLLAEVGASR